MKDKFTYNTEMAQTYETNARISIPTYDALFGMVQSYFRAEISGEDASVLVIGAGGGMNYPHGDQLTLNGPSQAWTFQKKCLKLPNTKRTNWACPIA